MLAVEQMVLEENEMLRNEGKRIGIDEGIIQVAKEMLKNGMQDEEIIRYTHLSKDKVKKLKSQIFKNYKNI